jgi:microsomal dipeptidase-like Zn-dependent dipeptidase
VAAGAIVARPAMRVALRRTERRLNPIHRQPPYRASAAAEELHRTLLIADLHADSLLWGRDLLVRGERGHSDVPRMIQGNVALQVQAVTTKSPRHLNLDRNAGDSDDVILVAIANEWPVRSWTSLRERALHQAARMHGFAARSDGALRVLQTREDVAEFVAHRRADPSLCAAVLSIEGAQCLEGDCVNVETLADAGFRMISPSHFFDTEMGGSAHGLAKGGLTEEGRRMVTRCEGRGVLVDVSHAAHATIADVLAMATRPVVASHGGIAGAVDSVRNLTDDEVRGIAATGGLVGVGFWDTVTGGSDAAAIARSIRYAVDLVGADHVALGSDWDGAVPVPFDATGLVLLTEALLADGVDEATIRKVMGENVFRLFGEVFPARAA